MDKSYAGWSYDFNFIQVLYMRSKGNSSGSPVILFSKIIIGKCTTSSKHSNSVTPSPHPTDLWWPSHLLQLQGELLPPLLDVFQRAGPSLTELLQLLTDLPTLLSLPHPLLPAQLITLFLAGLHVINNCRLIKKIQFSVYKNIVFQAGTSVLYVVCKKGTLSTYRYTLSIL